MGKEDVVHVYTMGYYSAMKGAKSCQGRDVEEPEDCHTERVQ